MQTGNPGHRQTGTVVARLIIFLHMFAVLKIRKLDKNLRLYSVFIFNMDMAQMDIH